MTSRAVLLVLGERSSAQPSPSHYVHTVPAVAGEGGTSSTKPDRNQGFRHTEVTRAKTHTPWRGAQLAGGETYGLRSRRPAVHVAGQEGLTVLREAVPAFGLLGLVCTRQSVNAVRGRASC